MIHIIVTITFHAPVISLDEQLLQQHHAKLQEAYESGFILMYGPREPEDGTIAIARVDSKQELESALASDPLLVAGLASCTLEEFIPIWFPTSLQGWVDPLGFHRPPHLAATPGPCDPRDQTPSP